MSPIGVTWRRTMGMARDLYSTALAFGGLVAISSACFVWQLSISEGGQFALPVVWAMSVAPFLPLFVALVGMDVWSVERQTGSIELLLTAPVRERDLTLGKFFGVWSLTLLGLLLTFAVPLFYLRLVSPLAWQGVGMLDFLPAYFVLALQGMLWSAVTVAFSAMFCHAAAAAAASVALTMLLPRGLWVGLAMWAKAGSTAFGEMPLDAHVFDIASGMISLWVVAVYLVLTVVFLFLSSKLIASLRLVGARQRMIRFSTGSAVLLSFVLAALALFVGRRFEFSVELPVGALSTTFSPRTRSILAESSGEIALTCFLPRSDVRWRSIGRIMRALKRESDAHGGARITLNFVDPRWNVGAAERLVRRGVLEDSLVFERGSRVVALPLAEGCDERACASTIRRLTMPPQRRDVYWTVGHGESRFDDYGTYGMSDIARDLLREGYHNLSIDLGQVRLIPGGCALIVVAGAKRDFSRTELDRLDAYLKEGGRLLVLQGEGERDGLGTLLASWGLRIDTATTADASTLSGSDVVVSGFSDHAVSASLKGLRLVLECPLVFAPSAAVATMRGADRREFFPLAFLHDRVYAAAIERGGDAGTDVAIRPTRIVAVGDPTFALNASLASRANANRDFFLNSIAYLAGVDASASSGIKAGVLATGIDREGRQRMVMVTAVAAPGLLFLAMALVIMRRRRRQ